MSHYISKSRRVEAWQHKEIDPQLTTAWPSWVLALASEGRIEEMPDRSIHVTDSDGRLLPLPIDYWLVYDEDQRLEVIAPDRFEAEFKIES